jgi:transketolase
MRIAFVKTLFEQAKKNKNIILLTADLGFSVFEKFMTEIPKQYLNVGISEQNMAGMAAGMAMEGKSPLIYSIVPFAVMRNFEQVRNDICYQNQNVKIVGVGAGFSYGNYGHTHHGLEDIGILRTLPNMTILAPGDPVEVALATEAMLAHRGPVYLRLGKAGEPTLHKKIPRFKIGEGIILEEGRDITIISNSTMLYRAHEVTQELKKRKIGVRLISMPTIKPLDETIILESAKKTKAIFTIEEHSIIGGLGSAVAEVIAENAIDISFKRIGVPDRFTKVMGLQEYMRDANELSVEKITKTIRTTLRAISKRE